MEIFQKSHQKKKIRGRNLAEFVTLNEKKTKLRHSVFFLPETGIKHEKIRILRDYF